jgi:type II secretory ATPase GspE/PulE/Tfp pilus assembly ATPase PilB-like protein
MRKKNADEYRGRVPVAEIVIMDNPLRGAVLQRADAETLQRAYLSQPGHKSLADVGKALLEQKITDQAEFLRVIGPQNSI